MKQKYSKENEVKLIIIKFDNEDEDMNHLNHVFNNRLC